MVVMVTSCARSLYNPTQQDFINARTLSLYMCHTLDSNSEEPSRVHYVK